MSTAFIVVYAGDQQYRIAPNSTLRVGRVAKHNDIENGLVLEQKTVSRLHAELENDGKSLYLKDLGSPNGTLLNGQPVKPNQRIKLDKKDKIKFAEDTSCLVVRSSTASSDSESESSEAESQASQKNKKKERSREKKQKVELSESTKKMLKGIEKYKSKDQKIKFLKLMGLKNAEEQWDAIEQQLRKTNKTGFNKANDQLQKQFELSRMPNTKSGLGRAL